MSGNWLLLRPANFSTVGSELNWTCCVSCSTRLVTLFLPSAYSWRPASRRQQPMLCKIDVLSRLHPPMRDKSPELNKTIARREACQMVLMSRREAAHLWAHVRSL